MSIHGASASPTGPAPQGAEPLRVSGKAASPLRVLSLFAGIGGFDLGLERTGGFKTVAFCEIEPFAVRVLNKHWPEVPVYGDIRELTAERLAADGIAVDVVCGGFPCQDISNAGKIAGLDGERSGLWFEYSRLIGELRPRFVVVENSAALLGRGLDRVLGSLATLGYDAVSHAIPASAVGAPHPRDRCWVIAYSREVRRERSYGAAQGIEHGGRRKARGEFAAHPWRNAFPGVRRVVHGVPTKLDRLRVAALGNAVVPQIPELIGRAILAAIAMRCEHEDAKRLSPEGVAARACKASPNPIGTVSKAA